MLRCPRPRPRRLHSPRSATLHFVQQTRSAPRNKRTFLYLTIIFIKILASIMKVKASIKNLRKRQGCKLVKRGKRMYVICKTNRRFKAKQG